MEGKTIDPHRLISLFVVSALATLLACTPKVVPDYSTKEGSGILCPTIEVAEERDGVIFNNVIEMSIPASLLPPDQLPKNHYSGWSVGDASRGISVLHGWIGSDSFTDYEGQWRLCLTEIHAEDVVVMEEVKGPGTKIIAWFLTGEKASEPLVQFYSDDRNDRDLFFRILGSTKLHRTPPDAR